MERPQADKNRTRALSCSGSALGSCEASTRPPGNTSTVSGKRHRNSLLTRVASTHGRARASVGSAHHPRPRASLLASLSSLSAWPTTPLHCTPQATASPLPTTGASASSVRAPIATPRRPAAGDKDQDRRSTTPCTGRFNALRCLREIQAPECIEKERLCYCDQG